MAGRRRLMKKGILAVVWICLVIFCCGCGGKAGENLKDYKIYRVEGEDPAGLTRFLIDLAKEEAGARLKNTADSQAAGINLLLSEASANEYGYTITGMMPKGFAVCRQENRILLLSPTEEGIRRACRYFLGSLVAEDGSLLLGPGERYTDTGRELREAVYIGDTAIGEYVIEYGGKEALPVCEELQSYIWRTSGELLSVEAAGEQKNAAIRLEVDGDGGKGIVIEDGQVTITGTDVSGLFREMYLFLNLYLGWMDAGKPDAHISSVSRKIYVPSNVAPRESWIEEREAIVTLWNVEFTRGVYKNEAVSLKNNILDYTGDQLYEYVKMLHFCGFTGIQATDMCSAWAGADSYQAVHEKLRMLADAAHSLDMKFTLWVWGAKFSGFSWTDPTVSYAAGESGRACDNPQTYATFEKYYSIYAELADCCDRVIGHYYDPGELESADDIAFFARMLRDKFLAVNPGIDFGVSCWVDKYDKKKFVNALGSDITLYEGTFEDVQEYADFRQEIVSLGTRLGTWAWNTCEMEIDQMAQMNFNMDIIREKYQIARKSDEICKPSYWSEMDSYHVLNAFSLYCAGQLLIDPDTDAEKLYRQLSEAAVGREYAEAFTQMLMLIQDARSGNTWSRYWWNSDDYILKSEAYPAQSILERCNRFIPVLQEMIDAGIESGGFPFPIPLKEVLQMMLPHLEQIRAYAQFRIGLAELTEKWRQGMSGEEVRAALREIARPIPDYNSVIGLWGQVEARAQREMVLDFCREASLEVPVYPAWDRQRKNYICAQIAADQKGMDTPLKVYAPYYQYGIAFGETERLVQELVEEGLLVREGDGSVFLADWEKYRYHFD